MRIIPNVTPKLFTSSAIIVGYLLIDDTTANEQNALGNWLMLIAQVLCTNAFYKQVQQERGIDNSNSGSSSNNSTNKQYDSSVNDQATELELLKKMVKAIQKEIDSLENNLQ